MNISNQRTDAKQLKTATFEYELLTLNHPDFSKISYLLHESENSETQRKRKSELHITAVLYVQLTDIIFTVLMISQ